MASTSSPNNKAQAQSSFCVPLIAQSANASAARQTYAQLSNECGGDAPVTLQALAAIKEAGIALYSPPALPPPPSPSPPPLYPPPPPLAPPKEMSPLAPPVESMYALPHPPLPPPLSPSPPPLAPPEEVNALAPPVWDVSTGAVVGAVSGVVLGTLTLAVMVGAALLRRRRRRGAGTGGTGRTEVVGIARGKGGTVGDGSEGWSSEAEPVEQVAVGERV